ncbi:uncharacterized protein LOC129584103 [Paramacrobiotus metropolitanus]|uniref:uncharacterized protein LOC129584103 n=1 Tax=Paramacrobiotus metropolitanus TaxID=2943436 RepID=UPI00244579A2|nr:uncharacterized protein LOC129584103 [Paramacrobiotus metropolitanus]
MVHSKFYHAESSVYALTIVLKFMELLRSHLRLLKITLLLISAVGIILGVYFTQRTLLYFEVEDFEYEEKEAAAHWAEIVPFVHVYSAFSASSNSAVHIIAATHRHRDKGSCTCIFNSTQNPLRTVTADREDFWDHHDQVYTASRFLCSLPLNSSITANGVHVTFQCVNNGARGSRNFAVYPSVTPVNMTSALCGPIIFGNYSDAGALNRFIRYYTGLGISRIFLCVKAVSADVMRLLQLYRKKQVVEIMNWNLMVDEHAIHYNGQIAAINECYLRAAKEGFDYVLTVDLDEFVILSQNTSISELMEHGSLDCVNIRSTLARVIDITSDPSQNSKALSNSNIQKSKRMFQRQDHINEPNDRSKYICRTQSVLMAGIHYPYQIHPETKILTAAPVNKALVLHFRRNEITTSSVNSSEWRDLDAAFEIKNYY